jgi:hypothetical protein
MNRPATPQQRATMRPGFGALLTTLCIALLNIGSSHAAPFPEQFSATYDVKKAGITIGETRRVLSRENGQYLFESITRPVGIATFFTDGQVVERSHWQFFQGQPRPLQYTFFNSGGKKKRNIQLDFDWKKNQVINTINNKPWTMPLEHGTSDKLLYQLRIMQDLATATGSLRYPVADGGKLKYYNIKILGKERIRTPLGNFETVRLQHTKGDRQTTMWCAQELDYLPVRIEQRKNNNSPMAAVLTSVTGFNLENKRLSVDK